VYEKLYQLPEYITRRLPEKKYFFLPNWGTTALPVPRLLRLWTTAITATHNTFWLTKRIVWFVCN